MYPNNLPAADAEKSKRNYIEFQKKNVPDVESRMKNISDAIKKIRTALSGGKKCGVKPGSNIKTDKTHEYWYLYCKAYQKLEIQGIKMKRSSLLKYINCAACFTENNVKRNLLGGSL